MCKYVAVDLEMCRVQSRERRGKNYLKNGIIQNGAVLQRWRECISTKYILSYVCCGRM